MYWMEFLTVALVHLLAVASPGPDFAVVVRESVTRGQHSGSWAAIGVGSGILLHVGYSLLGIGLIVSQSIMLFNLFKWLAAGYLFYLGFQALRAKPVALVDLGPSGVGAVQSRRRAFTVGFVTNGLNPKATLFFLCYSQWLSTPIRRSPFRPAMGYIWRSPLACGSAWWPGCSVASACAPVSLAWGTGSIASPAQC